jgi:hypothetical protein
LPFDVTGSASSATMAAGTMYSGNRSFKYRRSSAPVGAAPGAGTT